MKRLIATAIAFFAIVAPLHAQQEEATRQKLLGTWKLISVISEEIPSGARTELMGSNPSGFINYGSDGRMMVVIVRGDRKKPAGAIATPSEADALFRSMTAYAGTYKISGNKLTHDIDISWNETWAGTPQTRFAKFEGNRLTLATSPSPDPVQGKMSVRSLVWERVNNP